MQSPSSFPAATQRLPAPPCRHTVIALEGLASEAPGPAGEEGGGELRGWAHEAVVALAAAVRGHPSTAGEVAHLCKDLQVRS